MNEYDKFIASIKFCVTTNDIVLMEDLLSGVKKERTLFYYTVMKILRELTMDAVDVSIDYRLIGDFIRVMLDCIKNDDMEMIELVNTNVATVMSSKKSEKLMKSNKTDFVNFYSVLGLGVDRVDIDGNLVIVKTITDDRTKAEIVNALGSRYFLIESLEFISSPKVREELCHHFGYEVPALYRDVPYTRKLEKNKKN